MLSPWNCTRKTPLSHHGLSVSRGGPVPAEACKVGVTQHGIAGGSVDVISTNGRDNSKPRPCVTGGRSRVGGGVGGNEHPPAPLLAPYDALC
ncbi:hypothetical protein BaRGS_00017345 [Batillaria attramentaria]|uniref:Uncharacterized protein n=1 Tax=Batillaria attramentaria TaxID=370345 RepID=A0ABD0KX83_9CAEN